MAFFQNLNFTSANEDGRSELAVLREVEGSLVVLTGSGARPLDMLLTKAQDVIALDLNPAQNALLGLKIAAFKGLEYHELLAFLGVTQDAHRITFYHKIRPLLSVQDAAFWDRRGKILSKGVLYAGLWERVLRFGAMAHRVVRAGALEALFNAPTTEAQARIWREQFDDKIWRGALRLLGQRWIWTHVIGEPGGAYLPKATEIEAQLSARFTQASESFFFRESDFASLILRGFIAPPQALPLHLLPENFDTIRERLGTIRRLQGGLSDLPRLDLGKISGFSLSDFGSYCDAASYAAQWQGVMEVAAPDALYCERILLNALPLPSLRIQCDQALSDRLCLEDRAIVYQLRAGQISA